MAEQDNIEELQKLAEQGDADALYEQDLLDELDRYYFPEHSEF